MPVAVRELELDLDAFEGPFDLLLSLVLREELPLREVDLAEIVIAFVEHLSEKGELDLDACGEFLVLISALLELKARAMFPEEDAELAELEPEEAAEELARRLAEYRRAKEAAGWLRTRLDERRDLFFRLGPAPLAPKPERRLAPQSPLALVEALLVVASQPLSPEDLAAAAQADVAQIGEALDLLTDRYVEERSGIVLELVAGGWAFRASAAASEACARLFEKPVERGLTQAALETLAIVAYLGPITRPEIARIRGVNVDGVIAGLAERGLIAESGREGDFGAI